MMLLALLAFQVPLHAQPGPREAKVRLGWSPEWTETGITLAPGETLTIRVRRIRGSANDRPPKETIDPATGTAVQRPEREREKDSIADRLLKAGARQMIVGRIGEGGPFVVGREYEKVVRTGGDLSLRWNVPREMAAAERGFEVAIRVDPAPVVEKEPDDPDTGNSIVVDPVRNSTLPVDPDPYDHPPVENGSAIGTDPDPGNAAQPEQNLVVPPDPETAVTPRREATKIRRAESVTPDGPETGLSAAQMALVGGGVAALLLALAAAGVGVQRWRRRKLVNRTRSLLALSPSLDLGEGACRAGSLPAEGPAASLRARLEEGAIRSVEGGEDG
ncbi:MAG TPA: hypothetical protein VFQ67_15305 [Allosphingosinicella sp.]|jgi:hypothetical protein|nr:hypothetical protein [Allosphingosinicella sp.]